ncbi:MAG TPA: hypothetical protein VM008_06530 [Phycisphaerae bacterium]|nr:hypothetical protein [Phycisphaerae bacterium]
MNTSNVPQMLVRRNASAEIKIDAANPNNHTGISLQANTSYLLEVVGVQDWRDWYITTDPRGYMKWYLRPTAPFLRVPNQPYFALMGYLAPEPSKPFFIGMSLPLTPSKGGELICFANDVPCMYWNNSGVLTLKITCQG